MKTEKLTKTNIIDQVKASHIEFFLEKEIESVYTFKKGYKCNYLEIDPGTIVYKNNHPFRGQFFKHLKDVSFNEKQMVLTVTGRNAYERRNTTKYIQFKVVGYKLPTTQIGEGWIYGNGIFE